MLTFLINKIYCNRIKNLVAKILLSFDKINYLLENCGAFLAFLRPYFFLSFLRGSLVKNPFDFKAGLYSKLAAFKALAIP